MPDIGTNASKATRASAAIAIAYLGRECLMSQSLALSGICYLGRTGSCAVHAAILGLGIGWGPEVHIDDASSFKTLVGGAVGRKNISSVVRQLCKSLSSESENLFAHFPQEARGLDFTDHSMCSCRNPFGLETPPFLHLHSLLYSETLFQAVSNALEQGEVSLRLVVTRGGYSREVFSVFMHQLQGRRALSSRKWRWSETLLFLITCDLKHEMATHRLERLRSYGVEIREAVIQKLNSDPTKTFSELLLYLNGERRTLEPSKIMIRGVPWTGGRTPPFGNAEVAGEEVEKSFFGLLVDKFMRHLNGRNIAWTLPVKFFLAGIAVFANLVMFTWVRPLNRVLPERGRGSTSSNRPPFISPSLEFGIVALQRIQLTLRQRGLSPR